jgi:acyl-CoA thioesterase FadM
MPDYHCVTVNNIIDYKSSAVEGDTLIAETLLLENESKIIKLQCEIWNADRTRLIAIGISKMLKRVK